MKKILINMLMFVLTIFISYTNVCASEIETLASATSYDGRNAAIITPVRDQGDSSLCWAYAAISAAEASILKSGVAPGKTENTLSLSPLQLGYARHNRGADPLGNTDGESTGEDWYYGSGNSSYAPALFSQWCGPVADDLPATCNGWENASFLLKDSVSFDGSNLKNDSDARFELKKAILQYGAVTFSYNNVRESYYYNPASETGGGSYPHACTIIGWDDTIPASSFLPGAATQNGGWLIKNSYSSLPYFYLSYDNVSSNVYAFSFTDKKEYDYNYFYDSDTLDFGLGALLRPRRAANIFEAKKGERTKREYVSGTNIGIEGKNTTLTVRIYQDIQDPSNPLSGDLAATEEVYLENAGYYTVSFSEPVFIEEGSMFSVVAEISDGENSYFKITQNQGESFFNQNGSWMSVPYATRIKAYTKLIEEKIYFTDTSAHLETDENDDGIFIMGYYNKNKIEDLCLFAVKASETYSFDIPGKWKKADSCQIKGFLWKSISSIIPIFCKEIAWENSV